MAWSKPWYDEYLDRVGKPLSPRRLAYEIQNERHVENALRWGGGGAALGFLVVGIASISGESSELFIRFSVLAACLFSAMALGGLFGFLFGVPKSSTGSEQPAAAPPNGNGAMVKPANRVNTNLEEVSDWLTKLILGAGLTQIGALWAAFIDLSGKIGARGIPGQLYGSVIVGGLIIYGLIVGFLAGYILTRLYLSNIFLLADSFSTHEREEAALFDSIKDVPPPPPPSSSASAAGGGDDPPPSPPPSVAPSVAAQVSAVPVEEIKDVENLIKAARIHWSLGKPENVQRSLEAYRLVLARDPGRSDVRAEYAQRLIERHRYVDAADLLARAWRDMRAAGAAKETIGETARALAFAQLYLPKPESFEKALATIEEIARDPSFVLDVDWQIKRLSANGQKLRHLWSTLSKDDREALRKLILDDIRDVLEKNPRLKPYLQGLVEPLKRAPGSIDDDLEALRGDAELRTLLELPPLDPSANA